MQRTNAPFQRKKKPWFITHYSSNYQNYHEITTDRLWTEINSCLWRLVEIKQDSKQQRLRKISALPHDVAITHSKSGLSFCTNLPHDFGKVFLVCRWENVTLTSAVRHFMIWKQMLQNAFVTNQYSYLTICICNHSLTSEQRSSALI